MTFVIDAFSIEDQQNLWGLVWDVEISGDLIGYGPVIQQVEVVEIDGLRGPGPFQPVFDHGTGGAAGTVLENDLRAAG